VKEEEAAVGLAQGTTMTLILKALLFQTDSNCATLMMIMGIGGI